MSGDLKFAPPLVDGALIGDIAGRMGFASAAFGQDGNDERFAVLQEMSDIDVCACPGSGKTTLLVAKLGCLMSGWTEAGKGVCVISHTNVARNEIGKKLGSTPAGNKILAYPHFVGTIHSFVNEFLAIPWLIANGRKITTIDTDIALTKRLTSLYAGTQENLLRGNSWTVLEVISPNLGLNPIAWGKGGTLGTATPTYEAIKAAVKKSIDQGFFTYREMFVWANDLLDKRPEVAGIIRARFPMVFIDEAQDTTAEQAHLLHRIFKDGGSAVIIQRFGDGNQAIFGGDEDGGNIPEALAFPQAELIRTLPKSHRFGQAIADFADPLGLYPYKMEGLGPMLLSGHLLEEPAHTIFFFDDEDGAKKVPEAFADLLSVTFSDVQLKDGTFKAVGQVHRRKDGKGFPKDVGHYHELYDPSVAKNEANPTNFLEHVLHGRAKATASGQAFPAIDGIATAILQLFDLIDFAVPASLAARRNRHRKVIEMLAPLSEQLKAYNRIVQVLGSEKISLAEEVWIRDITPLIKDAIGAGEGGTRLNASAENFMAWSETNIAAALATKASSTGNTFSYSRNGVPIPIQFGSIHSVKGETHTATLVLETNYYSQNMASISDWIYGKKSGQGKTCSDQNKNRLKLHYVAMTRPSHLICLGLHSTSFIAKCGKPKTDVIASLESKGWRIKEI